MLILNITDSTTLTISSRFNLFNGLGLLLLAIACLGEACSNKTCYGGIEIEKVVLPSKYKMSWMIKKKLPIWSLILIKLIF